MNFLPAEGLKPTPLIWDQRSYLSYKGHIYMAHPRRENYFNFRRTRCKACRDARKNAGRGTREMFTAVCAACGKEARVPFKPREDRPVYCSDCFAKMKEEG